MNQKEHHFDVIVLGVGSMGSAACYHLAKSGAKVVGVEQFDVPHRHGSHHGKSRMIRKAYSEHPNYVPLLERAYELWEELQEKAQEPILNKTGALYLCESDTSVITGSMKSAKEYGLPHRHLNGEAIKSDYPAFRVNESFEGFFEPDGGYLRPEDAIVEHAWQASGLGAMILTNTPALDWKATNDGVEVRTAEGTLHADQLIISTGAWTNKMLKNLGVELTVTRQVQAWFEPKIDPEAFSPDNFPCWFIETDAPHGHYGFPILPGQKGVKIAEHRPGDIVPLEDISRAIAKPLDVELKALQNTLAQYIPDAAGQLLKSCTCLYTNSPDQHFIVDKIPDNDRVTIAAGFSGHGYKFSSVIGEVLANLATNGSTHHPIGFLGLERFRQTNDSHILDRN